MEARPYEATIRRDGTLRILAATVRETPVALTSKMFSEAKGHSLSYEAGLLTIRVTSCPDKLWLFPASNVSWMEAEDTPKKK